MNKDRENLRELILKFREDRDWKQFHKIKDLLLGLSIEVSELQELFLWKSEKEIEKVDKSKVENEIADIFIFLTYLCDDFDIDLREAVLRKIDLNNEKYPIEKSKGSNKKYNELKN
jgi:NTP pyrophosphatase (non-canonical NTP hydrolase)